MSGPKHLWSGDWEDESARAAAQRGPALPEPPEPEPPTPEPELAPANRTPPIRYAGVIVALVLVVGVVLAATLAGSSKKHNHTGTPTIAVTPTGAGPNGGSGIQTAPPVQTTPPVQTGPAVNLPSADWLGMQIVSSATGAVVNNVQLGTPGDLDGFEPGDGINSINGRQISSVAQIRSVTAKFKLGSQLRVQVQRGSTPITLVLSMRTRPTISP